MRNEYCCLDMMISRLALLYSCFLVCGNDMHGVTSIGSSQQGALLTFVNNAGFRETLKTDVVDIMDLYNFQLEHLWTSLAWLWHHLYAVHYTRRLRLCGTSHEQEQICVIKIKAEKMDREKVDEG